MISANGLSVLLVGFGFMGEAHFNNLQEIQKKTGQVYIAGVVDFDPQKLVNPKLSNIRDRCFKSLEEAYTGNRSYDIVVVATNTATHNLVIQQIFDHCVRQSSKLPAMFVEKPLVANTVEAEVMVKSMEKAGYGTTIPFTCGYIFRESPALEACLKYIQDNGMKIEEIETVWQKLRVPTRPSAGVHIDEATHPVDVLFYILLSLGMPCDNVSLKVLKREYARSIVDENLQAALYGPDHVPLATVDYEIKIGDILVKAHSSFNEAPQRRELWFNCGNDVKLKVACDIQNTDVFTVYVSGNEVLCQPFKNPNKLLREWETFLQNSSRKIPTLQDALRDIKITEELGTLEIGQEKKMVFLFNSPLSQ